MAQVVEKPSYQLLNLLAVYYTILGHFSTTLLASRPISYSITSPIRL